MIKNLCENFKIISQTINVDDREVKTEEALVTSVDKNKKKPKLDPGRVAAG